jgi:MFS family permease
VGDIWGRAALVVLGCLLAQTGLAYGYVFPALAEDILGEMGWTRSEFSFARLPQLAAMAAASPFVGLLSVRYGARRVIVCSVILLGATFLLFPEIDSLYQYYGLMMLTGIALTGVGDITVSHAVSQWVVGSRGLALGIAYAGSNLGGVLLVPAVVMLAGESDWRSALFAMGVGAFALLLPATALLVRERPSPERSAVEEAAARERPTARRLESDTDLNLRAALRTRSFWILFFSLFAFFFYFLALLEHMVLHFTDQGIERADAVRFYATAIGLGIGSKLLLGLVADRIHEKQSVLIDYAALASSSLVLLAAPSSALAWLFVVSFGFSYAARDVVYPLIVGACFGVRFMAPIYGALMLALLLGAGGPLFAAAVHDRFGSYDLAFRCFALINGIALVALFFLRDERRNSTQTPLVTQAPTQAPTPAPTPARTR